MKRRSKGGQRAGRAARFASEPRRQRHRRSSGVPRGTLGRFPERSDRNCGRATRSGSHPERDVGVSLPGVAARLVAERRCRGSVRSANILTAECRPCPFANGVDGSTWNMGRATRLDPYAGGSDRGIARSACVASPQRAPVESRLHVPRGTHGASLEVALPMRQWVRAVAVHPVRFVAKSAGCSGFILHACSTWNVRRIAGSSRSHEAVGAQQRRCTRFASQRGAPAASLSIQHVPRGTSVALWPRPFKPHRSCAHRMIATRRVARGALH